MRIDLAISGLTTEQANKVMALLREMEEADTKSREVTEETDQEVEG